MIFLGIPPFIVFFPCIFHRFPMIFQKNVELGPGARGGRGGFGAAAEKSGGGPIFQRWNFHGKNRL